MYTDNAEAAYLIGRVDRATALAFASVDGCARLSHETMAALYKQRVLGLLKRVPASASSPAPTA